MTGTATDCREAHDLFCLHRGFFSAGTDDSNGRYQERRQSMLRNSLPPDPGEDLPLENI